MIMGDMGKENLSKNVCRCSSLIRGTDAINSGLNKIVPHGINQIELLLQQVQIIVKLNNIFRFAVCTDVL